MALVHPGQAPVIEGRTTTARGFAPAVRRVAPRVLRGLLELILVAALFELYRLTRLLARGEEVAAFDHAVQVNNLERLLHLPSEAAIQGLVPSDTLLHLANVYYVSVHFPATILFLVWGYLFRPRAQYVWARNILILLTGAALVVHIIYPLAPPRMFPQWGFVDTMATFGPDAYAGASGDLANQFAAMPSLHIGWAALIAYVIQRTGPRWLAMVAALHLALTVLVVVVTANHYWLDGVVALVLLAAAIIIVGPPRPQPSTQPSTQPAAELSTEPAAALSGEPSAALSAQPRSPAREGAVFDCPPWGSPNHRPGARSTPSGRATTPPTTVAR
jgi:hypothetical protein